MSPVKLQSAKFRWATPARVESDDEDGSFTSGTGEPWPAIIVITSISLVIASISIVITSISIVIVTSFVLVLVLVVVLVLVPILSITIVLTLAKGV